MSGEALTGWGTTLSDIQIILAPLRVSLALHPGLISCQPSGLVSCTPEACEDGSPGCASDSEPPRVGDHTKSARR